MTLMHEEALSFLFFVATPLYLSLFLSNRISARLLLRIQLSQHRNTLFWLFLVPGYALLAFLLYIFLLWPFGSGIATALYGRGGLEGLYMIYAFNLIPFVPSFLSLFWLCLIDLIYLNYRARHIEHSRLEIVLRWVRIISAALFGGLLFLGLAALFYTSR